MSALSFGSNLTLDKLLDIVIILKEESTFGNLRNKLFLNPSTRKTDG